MHSVAILSHEHVSLFELACAVELFGLKRPEYDDWYHCEVVELTEGPFRSTANVLVGGHKSESLATYDTLIIPSWPVDDEVIPPPIQREVVDFNSNGKRILTFCSGAFLPAKLGILDGAVATTHWRYSELFRRRFPRINYVDDVLYVYDGRLGCSAGSAAGIDLGIEVIRQDFGYQRANEVARRLVMSPHRKGGQSQFAETPVLKSSSLFSETIEWVLGNLSQSISIDLMAHKACMSRRTFDRKFRAAYNCSPNSWLIQTRVDQARKLLESTTQSIENIAESAGFENPTSMRYHFYRQLGISPKQYRDQFYQNTQPNLISVSNG